MKDIARPGQIVWEEGIRNYTRATHDVRAHLGDRGCVSAQRFDLGGGCKEFVLHRDQDVMVATY